MLVAKDTEVRSAKRLVTSAPSATTRHHIAGIPAVLSAEMAPLDRGLQGAVRTVSVRLAIERAGAELRYLPPYSPDFNPIKMAFSKLKAVMRSKAERAVEGLWDAVGVVIPLFKPDECANYFAAAGYEPD
jgi:hypothetical protein